MKIEGLLVDLVPYDAEFQKLEYEWRSNDAQFWAGGGERDFVSRRQVEQMMARRYGAERQGPQTGVWFGVQTKDGVKIGGMGVPRVSQWHRWAMLGAKIGDPAYWGGGYGTDALLLIVDYAFDWLVMRRLWLKTMMFNARVLHQMEKVGFVREMIERDGTWVNNGWGDAVCYGLLREEWLGRTVMVQRLGLKAK
ncbi:MAG: GNAT family N-acetyltransferase [Anaerolineae bacterium]|nr:GNAT family N-acetyltransferase [Anaerolineae bacterium]